MLRGRDQPHLHHHHHRRQVQYHVKTPKLLKLHKFQSFSLVFTHTSLLRIFFGFITYNTNASQSNGRSFLTEGPRSYRRKHAPNKQWRLDLYDKSEKTVKNHSYFTCGTYAKLSIKQPYLCSTTVAGGKSKNLSVYPKLTFGPSVDLVRSTIYCTRQLHTNERMPHIPSLSKRRHIKQQQFVYAT